LIPDISASLPGLIYGYVRILSQPTSDPPLLICRWSVCMRGLLSLSPHYLHSPRLCAPRGMRPSNLRFPALGKAGVIRLQLQYFPRPRTAQSQLFALSDELRTNDGRTGPQVVRFPLSMDDLVWPSAGSRRRDRTRPTPSPFPNLPVSPFTKGSHRFFPVS